MLSLIHILINRETNLLVLDEPTNHLDVDAKEELKNALKEYKGTVLTVSYTHLVVLFLIVMALTLVMFRMEKRGVKY